MDLLTATRLQELRKLNGYSQEVLAEKLGVSRQSVSKWERAEASPEIDNLMALADIYSMTLDELLNTEKDKSVVAVSTKKDKDIKGKMKSLLSKANDFGIYPDIARAFLKFPYPIIVVIIYLTLSFVFGIWHPLWIIFMTIPIYYRFAIACKANNKRVFALLMPVPELVVTLFLILGAYNDVWTYPCLLFIIIPVYYWVTLLIKR